jgi:hypothetical protein
LIHALVPENPVAIIPVWNVLGGAQGRGDGATIRHKLIDKIMRINQQIVLKRIFRANKTSGLARHTVTRKPGNV